MIRYFISSLITIKTLFFKKNIWIKIMESEKSNKNRIIIPMISIGSSYKLLEIII